MEFQLAVGDQVVITVAVLFILLAFLNLEDSAYFTWNSVGRNLPIPVFQNHSSQAKEN